MNLLRDTLTALGAPRRLIPILLVSLPLCAAQSSLSRDPLALPLGVLMCLAFATLAPYLWRRFTPRGPPLRALLQVLAYGTCGLILVGLLGWALPRLLGVGATFLTGRESLIVSLALFWVGGWGLGRDIDFEQGLARERARADALAREAERAQLLAVRAHLDPHFLFNTLNAIAEWCREDGAVAEAAVLRLSSMLRTILAGVHEPTWSLARELDLCRDLFELHRVRDPSRLRYQLTGDPAAAAALVPPMILLPLAENAIKHGVAAGHDGLTRLDVRAHEAHVEITLRNPGPYLGPRLGGEGLRMVHRRLALAYDGRAQLTLSADGESTLTELTLPRSAPHLST
ncbi:MAG: histidine kinase [Nannocystis sp.]|nr:histidine kinase [Nannocystis sp.]